MFIELLRMRRPAEALLGRYVLDDLHELVGVCVRQRLAAATAFTTLKIAVVAPRPSASVRTVIDRQSRRFSERAQRVTDVGGEIGS